MWQTRKARLPQSNHSDLAKLPPDNDGKLIFPPKSNTYIKNLSNHMALLKAVKTY